MAIGDDPTFGTSSAIGRYFGIVSTVPSLVLFFWVYVLLVLDSDPAGPSFQALGQYNPIANLGHAVVLLAAAIVVAVVSHPVQFAIVQLLEGYWGPSQLGRSFATRRIMAHLRARDQASLLRELAARANPDPEALTSRRLRSAPDRARQVVQANVDNAAAELIAAGYPDVPVNVMPTRLGNILRRYEVAAGAAVGFNLITWASHIGMVADASHTAYVQDQRQVLDLAAKLTAVGLLCSALTVGVMWSHGSWALLTLVPFGAAWASYRGSLVAANTYGKALIAWVDLNRFAMYERLALPRPRNADEERGLNAALEGLSQGDPGYSQIYAHPAANGAEPRVNVLRLRGLLGRRRRSVDRA